MDDGKSETNTWQTFLRIPLTKKKKKTFNHCFLNMLIDGFKSQKTSKKYVKRIDRLVLKTWSSVWSSSYFSIGPN